MKNRIRINQLNVGWMASDHERELQAAETGDPDAGDLIEAFARLVGLVPGPDPAIELQDLRFQHAKLHAKCRHADARHFR